jgi:hypothetical protein
VVWFVSVQINFVSIGNQVISCVVISASGQLVVLANFGCEFRLVFNLTWLKFSMILPRGCGKRIFLKESIV